MSRVRNGRSHTDPFFDHHLLARCLPILKGRVPVAKFHFGIIGWSESVTVIAVVFLFGLLPKGVTGQPNTPAVLFAQGAYMDCLATCDSILADNAQDAQAHFYKGACYVARSEYTLAEGHLQNALDYEFPNPVAVQANLLRVDAGLRRTSAVVERLDSLLAQDFAAIGVLNRSEFAYLENDQAFKKRRMAVDRNANPCLYDGKYQKLDFWLGEWEVFVGNQKTAESTISKSQGGCTLHEDYRTTNGFYGTSYNYYDMQDSLYKQIWVDKFNSIIRFTELESKTNMLILQSNTPGAIIKMTYQYDADEDTVLQTLDTSSDNGATWNISFSGLYRRKKG